MEADSFEFLVSLESVRIEMRERNIVSTMFNMNDERRRCDVVRVETEASGQPSGQPSFARTKIPVQRQKNRTRTRLGDDFTESFGSVLVMGFDADESLGS